MKNIFFDLDDTLLHTQYKYNEAALECMSAFSDFFSVATPHPKMIMDHFTALELTNAKKFGFNENRFASSWVNTYRFFSDRLGLDACSEAEEKLYDIANKVNCPPFVYMESAPNVLNFIRDKVDEMFILTMGDTRVQSSKIDAMPDGMKELFDGFHIVSKKDAEEFKKIIAHRDPKECIMVGNSPRSDILPAIANGAYAVHIPTDTWLYDVHSEPFYYNKLYTIPSLKQLPNILRAIQED